MLFEQVVDDDQDAVRQGRDGFLAARLRGRPLYLDLASKIAPLRYAVDLTRAVYYQGQPATCNEIVLVSLFMNFLIMAGMFLIFLVVGTTLFVRSERNK